MLERQLARTDLCIFVPLALPWLGAWILGALVSLNHRLGLPGTATSDVATALFVNLLGLFAACFAFVRLQSPVGAWRRHTLIVKAAAALLIAGSVVEGAPALLLLIAAADALTASLLWRRSGAAA